MIDAKHYRGRRVRVRTEGGWGRPRTQTLTVGGRDQARLIAGMHWQVEQVRAHLAAHGGAAAPVTGKLCFVDADWPPLSSPLLIDGVHVLWPKKLKDFLFRSRVLDPAAIDHWHRILAGGFRSA